MKARIPKDFQTLNDRQKKKISDYATEIALEAARKEEERNCRIILDLYMKFTILILHEAFGFGEKRLRMFLGNHRREFRRQYKLVSKGEQIEYLDKRMAEIFRKDGFPQDFVDELIGKVEVVEE